MGGEERGKVDQGEEEVRKGIRGIENEVMSIFTFTGCIFHVL